MLQFWKSFGENSWTSQSCRSCLRHSNPNALFSLTKSHENSARGIGVMSRTRFRLQTNGRTPGRSLYPPTVGIKCKSTSEHRLSKYICRDLSQSSCRTKRVLSDNVSIWLVGLRWTVLWESSVSESMSTRRPKREREKEKEDIKLET